MNNPTAKEIKEKIDFREFLAYCGYDYSKSKSAANYLAFFKKDISELILLFSESTGLRYKVVGSDERKGDVIDFVKNRLRNFPLSEYHNSDYQNAIQVLSNYLKIPIEKKIEKLKVNLPEIKKSNNSKEDAALLFNYFSSFYNLRSLDNTQFLNYRGLTDETIASPLFKGRIMTCDYVKIENEKEVTRKPASNTCFIYQNRDADVTAYDIRYIIGDSQKKYFAKYSSVAESIWNSRHIQGQTKNLFIVESPIDALSHYQLNKDDSYRYVATGGMISNNQINLIKELVAKYNYTLILGNDLDKAGQYYNLKIINNLNYLNYASNIYKLDSEILRIEFKFNNEGSVKNFIQILLKTKSKFKENNQDFYNIQKDDDTNLTYSCIIPNTTEHIALFNESILKSFELKNIKLDYPKGIDWNNDLVESRKVKAQKDLLHKGINL